MTDVRYEVAPRKLAVVCAAAAAGAAAILTLFVLPAERGIDLTGLGSALGLTGMTGDEAAAEPEAAAGPAAMAATPDKATIAKATPLRSDEMRLVLPPHSGVEVKARMAQGDHMIFRWEATGPLKVDMHGERLDGGDQVASYWKETNLTSGQGALTAPFEGKHGWYWRNRGETPVTVKVRTSGFYKELFQPPPE
ncbi:transmembrane anchor protein [Phenylobacterium sp. LjRoot225]|uniref:hypothetical protein n=1 Tax=Phenylobacterium sp. LjRoot225 TaxID=3342285 RepID=UPI003ECCD99A